MNLKWIRFDLDEIVLPRRQNTFFSKKNCKLEKVFDYLKDMGLLPKILTGLRTTPPQTIALVNVLDPDLLTIFKCGQPLTHHYFISIVK